VRALEADPTIGAATTTMYFPDGRLQRNGSRALTYLYALLHYTFLGKLLRLFWPRRAQRMDDRLWYAEWDRRSARDIEVLPGSCIIAPRAVWAQTGGFDSRMLMYFSDDYLSRAVRAGGLRTVYLPSDGFVHYEGASAKQVSAWALRVYLRDLLVYVRLVFGLPATALLALLLIPTWLAQRWRVRRR
jgi:GT2 family glycosyltransferase